MVNKIGKIILLIFTCLVLVIFHFSLFSSLSGIWQYINLGLIFSVFALFFFDLKNSLYFIIIFGIFLDIFSFQFFGIYTLSLGVAAVLTAFALSNWLTNKSLYSFWAAILIFVFIYNLSLSLFSLIFSGFQIQFSVITGIFWQTILYQSFWAFIASLFFFNILITWLRKFKPYFLENKQGM